ncbi:MAG: type II secretion system F family protein [Candidatus Omnitrophica bacterium]|nr:type II secretion system F family protein [Candidatus Omnitrophota bacterium]
MLILLLIVVFCSAALLIYALTSAMPKVLSKPLQNKGDGRLNQPEKKAIFSFFGKNGKKQPPLIILSPLITAIIGFILFQNVIGAIAGGVLGLLLPSISVKLKDKARKAKFHSQLVDGLMVLSSSLKAGLSFFQALEVLVEEMPQPISDEFGLIIKENKMGIRFEESFEKLNKRMPSEDLNLITTAILIARDTGGNLTVIFENLANSIREKTKISEQVKTLTTQGRWQGAIMSFLPIGFAAFIFKANPEYLQLMLSSQLGRILLIYAVISELIGMFLISKLTQVEV